MLCPGVRTIGPCLDDDFLLPLFRVAHAIKELYPVLRKPMPSRPSRNREM